MFGRLVLLDIDLDSILEGDFGKKEYKVSYDSIKSFDYLIQVKESNTKRILDTGKKQKEIDPLEFAKMIGVNSMNLKGIILDIKEDYLTIIPSKSKRRNFHQFLNQKLFNMK